MNWRRILFGTVFALLLLGTIFRCAGILDNDFIFYDEGYYLNWNRPLGEILSQHHLRGGKDVLQAMHAYVSRCLASGKTLWFMLVDLRIFWGGLSNWFLARVWAAILGLATIALTFLFAQKFFKNRAMAWGSSALLAVLPSHVFYSRIGMQESLSALLVLAGFYFYLFPKKFAWQTLVAGGLWGLAYFSNYRLIMLPALISFCEIFCALSERRPMDFRKWMWAILVFCICVFGVGNFNHGQNTTVIFSWVLHQAEMATAQRDWRNIFSYPYDVLRLDTVLFFVVFFSGFCFLFSKDRKPLLLFLISLLQMGIFTFASEKGARYIGVVLPMMAMWVAYVIHFCWGKFQNHKIRIAVVGLTFLMVLLMVRKSAALIVHNSDYRQAVHFLQQHDRKAKLLATQPYILKLYFQNAENVKEAPSGFEELLYHYQSGYRYLVLCPQAYVSFTESQRRFDPPLRGYLGFIIANYPPQRVYDHFSPAILERFVMEHNENLPRSMAFLDNVNIREYGKIRIYDLSEILPLILKAAARKESAHPEYD